jgi:hypothetical protein
MAVLALEVIVHDQFAVGVGKDQVDAGALEVGAEQQMRVRNDNGIGRRMRRRMLDMHMGMRSEAVRRQTGVEFANEIQWATAKWLILV